ncbi:MAG TPA: hypothetical protein DD723_07320 [Candidatus Omnitrophica bacterium]|nr:MAG: hypothetical protein A2Z81_09230 [Omnitrophica WOR_2 bacterium GWA2_45_18]HBR15335.1 hypothetical protein [Candidatus Omnitrophota bacterium]
MNMEHPTESYLKVLFEKIKIKDIMTTSFITIHEDARFSEAFEKFRDHHISHLLVIKGAKRLVGILSQKYLYKAQSPRKILSQDLAYGENILIDGDSFYDKETLDRYILSNIMQPRPYTLLPDDSVAAAITDMSKKNLGCIPIVDGRQDLCGVITDREIVHFVAQSLK